MYIYNKNIKNTELFLYKKKLFYLYAFLIIL